jgi:hypothetical protein
MKKTNIFFYNIISALITIAVFCEPISANTHKPYFSHTKSLGDCYDTDQCYELITLTQLEEYTVKMVEHQWLGDVMQIESEAEGVIVDKNNNLVEKEIGGWTEKIDIDPDYIKRSPPGYASMGKWHRPNRLSLVDTPEDFPLVVFLSTNSSISNVSHTYIFYTTNPSLRKVCEIAGIITQYQATGTGTALNVTGFYRQNGDILFDRLTTDRQKTGRSNASQKYSLETFKITPDGVVSIRLEDFNYLKYRQQYNSKALDSDSF